MPSTLCWSQVECRTDVPLAPAYTGLVVSEKNVSLTEDVLALLKQRAKAEGISIDDAATEAVRIGLEESRWRALLAKGERYARASGYTENDVETIIESFRNEIRGR